MVNFSERPAEVEDWAVPGHWEGDLITGPENKLAIGRLVERSAGYVVLLHLPGAHGALVVQNAIVESMSELPAKLRRTLTWNQGREMSNHIEIAAATELDIYFCDPHSPWQRASNENTNGLLRQYFPKGIDLSGYHPDYLDFVSAQLNSRPRKRLGWKTPAEALDQLLSDQDNPHGVALVESARAEMLVSCHQQPQPDWRGTNTMDNALEARSQRIVHHLTRPLAGRGNLLNANRWKHR